MLAVERHTPCHLGRCIAHCLGRCIALCLGYRTARLQIKGRMPFQSVRLPFAA